MFLQDRRRVRHNPPPVRPQVGPAHVAQVHALAALLRKEDAPPCTDSLENE